MTELNYLQGFTTTDDLQKTVSYNLCPKKTKMVWTCLCSDSGCTAASPTGCTGGARSKQKH